MTTDPIPPPSEADKAIDLSKMHNAPSDDDDWDGGDWLYKNDRVKAVIRRCHAAEAALRVAEQERDALNRMLRETGQGQGAIDAYVSQCEELDSLRDSLAALRTRVVTVLEPFAKYNLVVDGIPSGFDYATAQDACRAAELLAELKQKGT